MDQNNNADRSEIVLFAFAIIASGGITLAYLYTLSYYIPDRWFLMITLGLMLGLPVLAYLFGRHRKGKETELEKTREHERHMAMWSIAATMAGGKRADVIDATPRTANTRTIPYFNNGTRANPPIDYRTMAQEWLYKGYPYFTREYLHDQGAGIGDNNNYKVLTAYLLGKNAIRQTTGKLPSDDSSVQEHLLYQWADSTGKVYGRREIESWINTNDWGDI